MLQDCAFLTILIGSAQEEDTEKNPFSVREVEDMIRSTLTDDMHRIRIIPINDINDFNNWSQYVLKNIGSNIDAYYCGSEEDAAAFLKEKEMDIVILDRVLASAENDLKSGTEIRKMLLDNNIDCLKYVPEGSRKYLRRMIIPF